MTSRLSLPPPTWSDILPQQPRNCLLLAEQPARNTLPQLRTVVLRKLWSSRLRPEALLGPLLLRTLLALVLPVLQSQTAVTCSCPAGLVVTRPPNLRQHSPVTGIEVM